ncbi:RNA-binding NOB1-like protein [Typha latifolia]|uniref:RNA-binding NOB1-like protein n=1 Tax=Typha latifolia TaxID=4733 RepID=UPI003C30BED7
MEAEAPPLPSPLPQPASSPSSNWSAVLQKKPDTQPRETISSRVFSNCRSSKGISVAVVDANAVIHGDKLSGFADKFVSVKEVLEEVRDPVSRHRLSFLPFPVETMEPSPEFIKKVIKFAKETGDFHTLSDVDIKIIALAYMLESQIHGTNHLREQPPPLHVVNVKRLAQAEMPGWGSNVPNLAEWEALEQTAEEGRDSGSRILPLKDMNNQVIPTDLIDNMPEEQDDEHQSFGRPRKFLPQKKEIKVEGKKMVAAGVDASQGEYAENMDDWLPAVSRSTHRRYLRRQARRELSKASEENDEPFDEAGMSAATAEGDDVLSGGATDCIDAVESKSFEEKICHNGLSEYDKGLEGNAGEFDASSAQGQMRLGNDAFEHLQEEKKHEIPSRSPASNHFDVPNGTGHGDDVVVGGGITMCIEDLDNLDITSQPDESVDALFENDGSSEQSWNLRSLSDSSVACVTSDYAMQNVILQIGLRLLAPGGMQIRQLHRWVLKCHACNKVTQETGRIFCPKCGNGGTLRKVSVTVGENGIELAARCQRILLRGTKFSLPMPQGGREAITKNLILREDQLPHKLLYPKSKKKSSKQDQDFISSDDIFSHSGEKRAPLKPPVRKALAVFSGKRNPNDNHFSRRKH